MPQGTAEMQKKYTSVAKEATIALGLIGDKRALPKLTSLMEDENFRNIYQVLEALGNLGDKSLTDLLIAKLAFYGENAAKALDKIDPKWKKSDALLRAIPTMLSIIKKKNNRWGRTGAAYCTKLFAELNTKGSIDALISIAEDSDLNNDYRIYAIEALGTIDSERTRQALLKALSYKKGDIANQKSDKFERMTYGMRGTAARALGDLNEKRAVEPLIPLLKDIRWIVLPILDKLDPAWRNSDAVKREVPSLKEASGKGNVDARESLKELLDKEALMQPLIFSIKNYILNSRSRSLSVQDLDRLDPEWRRSKAARDLLLDTLYILKENDGQGQDAGYIRSNAMTVLGILEDPRARDILLDNINETAGSALLKIGEVDLLINIVKDDDGYIAGGLRYRDGIMRVLRDNDPYNRFEILKLLTEVINDNDFGSSYRGNTSGKLATKYNSYVVEPMIKLVRERMNCQGSGMSDCYDVGHTIRALGDIGDRRATDIIIKALQNPIRRSSTHYVLRQLGEKRAVPHIINAMKDGLWSVDRTLDELEPNWRKIYKDDVKITVDNMIEKVRTESSFNRRDAVRALGKMRDRRAIDTLISAMLTEERDYEIEKYKESVIEILAGSRISRDEVSEKTVEALIKTLEIFEPSRRGAAVWALGKIADPKLFDHILPLLDDKNNSVQGFVVAALGNSRDKRAIKPLLAKLKETENREVNGAIILALARISPDLSEDEELKKVMMRLVPVSYETSSEPTRETRVLEYRNAPNLLQETFSRGYSSMMMRGRVAAILNINEPDMIEPLIEVLRSDQNTSIQDGTVRVLSANDDSKIADAMLELLETDNVSFYAKFSACRVLYNLNDPRVIEPLISLLKDGVKGKTGEIAEMLGYIGDVRAVEPLITVMHDKSLRGDIKVAEALRRLGDKRAIEPMIESIKEDEKPLSTIRELGKFGDSRAIMPIIDVLKRLDKKSTDIRTVLKALNNLSPDDLSDPNKITYYYTVNRWDRLIDMGGKAVEPLIALLDNDDVSKNINTIWALGEIGDKRAVEPLIAMLNDTIWSIKMEALKSLNKIEAGWTSKDSAVKLFDNIIKELKDEDWRKREDAARMLGIIVSEESSDALTAALKDEDWGVRWYAANGLYEIGDKNTDDALVAALSDENWGVRKSVAAALQKIGWEPENSDEEAHYLIAAQDFDIARLKDIGEAAIEPLINLLNEKSGVGQKRVEIVLDEIAPDWRKRESAKSNVVDYIKQLESSNNSDTRKKAAEVLGSMDDERAIEPLIAALNDSDEHVRESVVIALGNLGDKRASAHLVKTLYDESTVVQAQSAIALGKIGDPDSIKPLIQALEGANDKYYERSMTRDTKSLDALVSFGEKAVEPLISALEDTTRNNDIRRFSATTLGKIGDKRAIKPLVKALKDNNGGVRSSAASALKELGWEPNSDQDKIAYYLAGSRMLKLHYRSVHPIVEMGDKAVEPLIETLKYDDWNNGNAAKLLGQIGDPRAVEPLIKVMQRKDSGARNAAIAALGQIGDIRAYEPLLNEIQSRGYVNGNVIQALGELGDPRAVEPIIALLDSSYNSSMGTIAVSLGKLGDPRAVEPLIALLDDYEKNNRYLASVAIALGEIGDSRAVEPLLPLLKSEDWSTKMEAVKALGKIGDRRAIAPIVSAMLTVGHRNWFGKDIKEVLKAFDDEESILIMIDIINKSDSEQEKTGLSNILSEIDPGWRKRESAKVPVEDYVAALKDKERSVRVLAAIELEKMGYEPKTDEEKIAYYMATIGNRAHTYDKSKKLAAVGAPAVDALIKELDKHRHVYYYRGYVISCAKVLGMTGDRRAIVPLIRALSGNTDNGDTLTALRNIDRNWQTSKEANEAIDILIGVLSGKVKGDLKDAVTGLGVIKDPRAVEPLINALKVDEVWTCVAVINALAKIGDSRAIAPLKKCIEKHGENSTRGKAAKEALKKL